MLLLRRDEPSRSNYTFVTERTGFRHKSLDEDGASFGCDFCLQASSRKQTIHRHWLKTQIDFALIKVLYCFHSETFIVASEQPGPISDQKTSIVHSLLAKSSEGSEC